MQAIDRNLTPKNAHRFLTDWFYYRRSKMNPFWCTVTVIGMCLAEISC